MTDEPVNLDEHRGMAAQRDTEIRRLLHDVRQTKRRCEIARKNWRIFSTPPPPRRAPKQQRARDTFSSCSPPPPRLRTRAGNGSSLARSTTSPASPSDRGAVQTTTNPKAYRSSIMSLIFSAVISVGKLVLAQGTAGNSEASTTRSPATPRTRP